MTDNIRGAVWRLTVFTTACAVALVVLLMIFAQLRFQDEDTYRAVFTDATGLEEGNFVRIAGVEVGKVKAISIQPDSTITVDFSADKSVHLTDSTRAAIRWADLYGHRYLALEDGAGAGDPLAPNQTIPLERTQPALDLDDLIGGFRPLFRALDPDQVNALTGQLIAAFQGQGTTISSFLAQTATLTSTLADRDELIGQVITNLQTVLRSLGEQHQQVDKAVSSLAELVNGLSERRADITTAVAATSNSSQTLANLLQTARPPLQQVVHETDRTAGIVVADHDYFDNLLATLPDAYQALSRQAIYGDFFSFYLCDAVLKLNGKGGEPVYVKVAGQVSGRCAPR